MMSNTALKSLIRDIEALSSDSDSSLKSFTEGVTEVIASATGYGFVGLLIPWRHKDELVLSAWHGAGRSASRPDPVGLGRPLHIGLDHPWFSQTERTKLISLDSLEDTAIADYLSCRPSDVTRMRQHLRLRGLYLVKLVSRRRLAGLLAIGYDTPVERLEQTEVELLDYLSGRISVSLDNRLLSEENQHIRRQLKESNAKLVELDEARDDFISMASHQLRTPLTSVKGYTSMVLEGDAGKLTPMQRKLLSQSFFSAQRMVYLVADLLNVSRLKTGKFVMEATPFNLADVVQEEVDQLKEIAANRSIKLTYVKPKKFPEVVLDETKIHQVVMNFIDNAIYYTPVKGHIDVKLVETPTTIELRVKDNGMGVPKREQPHLFTKFYRAANARKSRPDGTGIGLFMVKKAIVAQGGSIIFDSEEGKGSTFGFVFSKHKIVKAAAKE